MKQKCTCPCHHNNIVKHTRPCCTNGFMELPDSLHHNVHNTTSNRLCIERAAHIDLNNLYDSGLKMFEYRKIIAQRLLDCKDEAEILKLTYRGLK